MRPNRTLLAMLAALVAGCSDMELEPTMEPPAEAAETIPETEEAHGPDIVHPVRGRIELTISTTGPLLPGEDVKLTVHGVAEEPIDGGEVALTLPTRALMDHDGGTALPELPVVARWDLPSMAVGETWSASHTIPGEAEGYYRVLVNAYTHGPDGGPWLFDDVFRSAWLYVHETDGRLTRFFEEAVFPEGVHPVAGPADQEGATHSRTDTTPELHSDSVYLHVVYSISQREGFKPAVGARIWAALKKERGYEDRGWKTVPEDGIVAFKCTREYAEYVLGGGEAPVTALVQGRKEITSWTAYKRHCGKLKRIEVKPHRYYPWRVLNLAADTISQHFGYTRKMVKWNLGSEAKYVRQYDKISLVWGNVDKDRFLWVVAHEYAHAYHHKALGGLFGRWSTPGCKNHSLTQVSSYECALSEGFADYAGNVGSVTSGDPDGYYGDCFEHWGTPDAEWKWCRNVTHDSKPKIEGWVAALFTDLIDDTEEEGDYTEYPARYIAEVFKTCEVKKGGWDERSNVSDIVWCLERNIDVALHEEVFPGVETPKKVREGATEPDNWRFHHIRFTWEKNLK